MVFLETPSDVVDGGEEGLKTADEVGPGAHGKEGRTSEVEKRSESPETGSIASRAKSMKRGRKVFLSKVRQRSTREETVYFKVKGHNDNPSNILDHINLQFIYQHLVLTLERGVSLFHSNKHFWTLGNPIFCEKKCFIGYVI